MYAFVQVLREAGAFGYVQIFGALLGGLWALVCAVLLGIRWRVPPIVAAVPLLLTPLTAAVGASWGQSRVEEALRYAEPDQRAVLLAAGISESLAQGWFGLLVVPTAALLGLGALAGGIRAPRAWGMPALVFMLGCLVTVLPVAGLFSGADPLWVIGRVLLYGAGVIPLALATANAHPAKNGPEAGMIAAAAYASVVAAGELAHVTAGWARGFAALANVSLESRADLAVALGAELGTDATLGWVALALVGLPVVLCAFRQGPNLTEEEILAGHASAAPWRSLARVLAVLVWPAWAIAFLALDPSEAVVTIAKAAG